MRKNIEYLQSLGLTEYQAKAVVVMFLRKECTAKEISELTGIPLTKVYQVLESLNDKELVSGSFGKPKLYKTITPNALITKLIKKKERRVKKLMTEKEIQLKLLKEIELPLQPIVSKMQNIHPAISTSHYELS